MRDHDPINVDVFNGTFSRGDEESVELGFFIDSLNIRFHRRGFSTRYGTSQSHAIPDVRRVSVYKRTGEAQRLLILDGSFRIWDSNDLNSPILTVTGMTDFSAATIFDRSYITPHDGETGLPGEKVYVYTGSGSARPAAGVAPTQTLSALNSGLSGTVELGARAFAVAYETSSGFITKFGGFTSLISLGDKQIEFSNIAIGPSYVVARHIVATKAITSFDGDFEHQTYYFIPGGRIPDNTATAHTVDFFDADLEEEASYLFEQVEEIPAGVTIKLTSEGRMLVGGENLNPSIVRVSLPGEPESHNAVEGFITVNPGDSGGPVKNTTEYRGQILIGKDQRFYVTQPSDNPPSTWKVDGLDTSIGVGAHGIARSLDYGENFRDIIIVADRSGLHYYAGTFSLETELSHTVDDIWSRITETAFKNVEVVIDPINEHIYCSLPLDGAATPTHVLFGDYSEGLTQVGIKWTLWSFPENPTSIVVDVVNDIPVFRYGSSGDNIYYIDSTNLNDHGTAINNFVEYPLFPTDDDGKAYHFTGIRLRVKGSGVLRVSCRDLDSVQTLTADPITLEAAPGRSVFAGFDFTGERCSVKLELISASEWFRVTKFVLYYSPLWEGMN